jgi:hypothetical protein
LPIRPAPKPGLCFRDRREVGHLVKRTNGL